MTPGNRAPGLAPHRGTGLRADARRNRERIVEAARIVFAEQGLDASMNEIARRAGVGLATLLRRFPTRDELIAAALGERVRMMAGIVDEAAADPDPWRGFCSLVERIAALQVGDRGFAAVLTQAIPGGDVEQSRGRIYPRMVELFDRAKAAGGLRPDFSPHDFPMVMMAHAGVVTATAGLAPTTSPRLIAYLLQAFSAKEAGKAGGGGRGGPLPDPPTYEEMDLVLRRYQPGAPKPG